MKSSKKKSSVAPTNLLELSTPSFIKAVDDAKLIHGPSHIKVARAYSELGEHYFKKGDLIAAKENLEISLKMQADLAGGRFSRGAYTWKEAIPPEEFLDTHYRLGQVIAGQAQVTGSSEESKKHLIKTLGMREQYDSASQAERDTVNAYKLSGSNEEGGEVIGGIGSALDSTLVYMDQAEEARIQGDFKEAGFLLLKAINLRRKKFGANSTASAQVLGKYAEILRVQFKYAEAREVLDEVLAINMAAYGADSQQTCDALNSLGQIHRLLGNLDESESLLLEAFQIRRKMLGDHHVATASSLNNLAELSRERGDYFQAINYHNRAIEAFTASVGEQHPGTVNAKGNLGVTLRRQAKMSLEEGETLVKEAFEQLQTAHYDDQHPWVLKFGTENVVAQAQRLHMQGKHDESIALYDSLISKKHVVAQLKAVHDNAKAAEDQAVRELRGTLGADETADIDESSLGEVRRKYRKPANQDLVVLTEGRLQGLMAKARGVLLKGKYGEADQALESAVTSSKVVLGEEHPVYFRAFLLMIEIKTLLGRFEECNHLLSLLLQLWTDLKGPDHIEVAEVAAALAQVYLGQGLYDAAATLYAQVTEVVGHKLQYDPMANHNTGSVLNVLYCQVLVGVAGVYIKQGYYADAVASLKQARAVFSDSVDPSHPLLIDYYQCYGDLRIVVGQPALAQSFYQEGLDRALALYTQHHPVVARCMGYLGQAAVEQGKWADASAYIEESLYVRLKTLPDDHPDVSASESAKGELLATLGKYDDALIITERALVSQRVTLGQRHPDVAHSLAVMAAISRGKGQPKEALGSLQLSLDIYRECLGHLESHDGGDAGVAAEGENALTPNLTIIEACVRLGLNAIDRGCPLEAVNLLEKARNDREVVHAVLGEIEDDGEGGMAVLYAMEEHPRMSSGHLALGRAYSAMAMNADAAATITEAGAALVKIFGEKSAAAGEAILALAEVNSAKGLTREALVQYSHAHHLMATQLNPNHPRLLAILTAAAGNMLINGYNTQCLGTVEYVLATLERQLPGLEERNELAYGALVLKGRVYMATSKENPANLPAAEKLLESAMYAARQSCGSRTTKHAAAMCMLATCLTLQGKRDKVEPALQQAMAITREAVGGRDEELAKQTKAATLSIDLHYDSHPFLGDVQTVYAGFLCASGRPGKANQQGQSILEKEVLPLYQAVYGALHPVCTFTEGMIAKVGNVQKVGSGKEKIRQVLRTLQTHGDPVPEGQGQYAYPADSLYVSTLGGYDDFYHNYMSKTTSAVLSSSVHSLCLWTLSRAAQKSLAPDSAGGGTEDDDAASRVSGLSGRSGGAGTALTAAMETEDDVGSGDVPSEQCLQLVNIQDPQEWGRVGGLPPGRSATRGRGGSSSNSVASADSGGITFRQPMAGKLALMVFDGEAPVSAVLADLYASAPGADPEEAKRARKRERERQEREAAAAAELAAMAAALEAEREVKRDDGSVLTDADGAELALAEADGSPLMESQGIPLSAEEKAAAEALRSEVTELRQQRLAAEEAVKAVMLQREEQERVVRAMQEEVESMEKAHEEHRAELEKVQQELLSKQRQKEHEDVSKVAAAAVDEVVKEGVDRASRPNSAETAGFPSVSGPGDDSMNLGVDAEDEDAPPPIVVAVSTLDDDDHSPALAGGADDELDAGEKPLSDKGSSRPLSAVQNGDDGPVEVPLQPATPLTAQPVSQSSDGMARVAMEASFFLFDRATALSEKGWYAKAKPIFQECLDIRDQYADGQPALTQAVIAFAENFMLRRKYADATLLLRRAKDLRVAEAGGAGKSRDIAYVMFLQSAQLYHLSRFTKASQMFLETVKMLVDTMPSGDILIGRAICLQALNTAAQGKLLEAKAQAEKGYAILAKACGTKRVELAEGFVARIRILLLMGKPKDALSLLQQAISLRKRLVGNDHPLVLEVLELQVTVLMDTGKLVECEEWMQQCLDMANEFFYDEASGSDDIRVSSVKLLYGRYWRLTGKHLEAEQQLLNVLQVRRAWIKPLEAEKAKKEKEKKEKEEKKKQALAEKEKAAMAKAAPKGGRTKAKVKATSGISLDDDDEDLDAPLPVVKTKEEIKKEEYEAAEAAEEAARELAAEIADVDVAEVLLELLLTYRALGDGTSFDSFLAQLDDMVKRIYKEVPVHPAAAEVAYNKAECARGKGDYEAATALMTHAVDVFRRSCGKDHPSFARAQGGLADILANKGLHDEAESMLRKVQKAQKAAEMGTDSLEVAYVNNSYAECLRLRGNRELAEEAAAEVLTHRQMLFGELNPDHLEILESVNNVTMLAMEAIIPPPEDDKTKKKKDDDDDEDEDAFEEDNDNEDGPIGDAFSAGNNDMSIASSAGPSVPPRAEVPQFQVSSAESNAALVRDEEGVPIFDNSAFVACRDQFSGLLARLASQIGPVLAVNHPFAINLTGNIAVVDKIEADEKERFLFGLVKADRKLFLDKEKSERRRAAAAAAAGDGEPGGGDDEDGDEGEAGDTDTRTKASVTGDGAGTVATADTNNTRAEILSITSTQANIPEDERVPLYLLQMDAVMQRLRQLGCAEEHCWLRKFRSYRMQEAKAPSEMTVARERLREAEKLRKAGMYGLADSKYDEALSCQVEFLGRLKAAEDAQVAGALLAKADNARTQCNLERSRKLYLQAYAVWLRADGGGEESEGCLKALQGMAELLLLRGQAEHASIIFQRVFETRKRAYAVAMDMRVGGTTESTSYRDAPCLAQSLHALARVALFNADLDTAENYSKAAMDMMERMERDEPKQYFVDDYGNTADIRLLQARVCMEKGQFSAAETFLKNAKKIRTDVNACGEDHPDNANDWMAMARALCMQERFHDARKLVGKAMRTRLKYFGKLSYNLSKLSLDSRAFLDTILDSASHPAETALEDKRLLTVGATNAPLGLGLGAAPGDDQDQDQPAPDEDADVASMIDGSIASSLATGNHPASNAGAGRGAGPDNAQYAAAQAVVVKALEVPRDLDGHKIPSFRWKGVPVSNHCLIAESLWLRGRICRLLGDFEESKLMTESCLNIHKDLFGRKSVPVADSLYELADYHSTTGVLAEALSLHVVALDIRRQFLLGSPTGGHPLVADSMLAVGALKIALSRLNEGMAMFKEVMTMRKAMYGQESSQYAEAKLGSIQALLHLGHYEEASEGTKTCLATFKKCYTEPHSFQAECLRVEAQVQLALGVTENAHAFVDQAYAQYSSIFAENHLECLATQRLNAQVLIARGRFLEAKAPLETVLAAHKEKFGKAHRETATTLFSIGVDLTGLGKYTTALPILERSTQLLRRAIGEEHLFMSYAYDALGDCHMRLAHYPKAKAIFDRSRLIRTRVVGEQHPSIADSDQYQGCLDMLHGHYDPALRCFDDATALRRQTLRSMHPAVACSLQLTGEALFHKSKYPEARGAFERALKMRRAVLHAEHADIVETAVWLGRLNEVAGKLDQASAIYERCLINIRNAMGSRHPTVAFVLTLLGEVSNNMGNYDLARSYLLDSLVIRTDVFGSVGDPAEEAQAAAQAEAQKKAKEAAEKSAQGMGRKAREEAEAKARAEEEERQRKHKCFHPELASTLLAMADNLRLRGFYGAWEGKHLADTTTAHIEENKEKEEEYQLQQAILAEEAKRGKRGRDIPTQEGGGADTGSIASASVGQSPEKVDEEQQEDDDRSVASVGLETGEMESTLNAAGKQLREEHFGTTLQGHTQPSILPDAYNAPAEGNHSGAGGDGSMPPVKEMTDVVVAQEADEGSVITTNSPQGGWTPQDAHGIGMPLTEGQKRQRAAHTAAIGGEGEVDSVDVDEADEDSEVAVVRRKHSPNDYAEYEFAMPMYERCLEILLTQFGAEHPSLYRCQYSIGLALVGLGNYSLAHDLHQHVLIHRRRYLGDDHLDSLASFISLADMLRFLAFVYPSNTAAAAEKRNKNRKIKVGRSLGPTLMEHLGSILGDDKRLKEHWPPQVTHELSMAAKGKHAGPTPHPLLAPKYPQPERVRGGYMGYSFPPIKKLSRDSRAIEGKVTRPDHSRLNDAKWLYDTALKLLKTKLSDIASVEVPGADGGERPKLPVYPSHPVVADALYGKAELMRQRRDNDSAVDLQEYSLAMRRIILKSSHVAVSDCLLAIAESLRFENRFKKAESLLLKCLQLRETAFSDEEHTHPSISEAKCCLAMLYYAMGAYEDCPPLYEQSLRERERTLGPSHIATAQSLNNYAGFLHTTGKYHDALPLYRRTLKIKRETFGDEHNDVASAKNNLGLLLKAMGQHEEAIVLYEQALDTLMNEFGKYHADVGSTLNNMAALYVAIGDTRRGRELYRDALMVKKKVLGLDHVGVAAALNNLAGLCFSCGDIDEAKDYYEESLRIRREKYGDDHPTVAESLNNIGLLLFSLGEYINAQPLFERAVVIKKESFGLKHISTASSVHNLAILLHKLKRFADAEKMYKQAFEIRSDTLGADHPDTLATLENLKSLSVDNARLGSPSTAMRGGTANAVAGSPLNTAELRPLAAPHGASGIQIAYGDRSQTAMEYGTGDELFRSEQTRTASPMVRGARARRDELKEPGGVSVEGFEFLERGTVPLGVNKQMTSLTREAAALIGKDPMDLGVLPLDGEGEEKNGVGNHAMYKMDGDMSEGSL